MTTQYMVTFQPAIQAGGPVMTIIPAPANSGMAAGDIVLSAIVDPASPVSAESFAAGANIPTSMFSVVVVPTVPSYASITPAPGVYLSYTTALGPVSTGSPQPLPVIMLLLEHP